MFWKGWCNTPPLTKLIIFFLEKNRKGGPLRFLKKKSFFSFFSYKIVRGDHYNFDFFFNKIVRGDHYDLKKIKFFLQQNRKGGPLRILEKKTFLSQVNILYKITLQLFFSVFDFMGIGTPEIEFLQKKS